MRRNCNLELRLLPPSYPGADVRHDIRVEESNESPQNQQQQQLTIFYNGKVCVCDVTELQKVQHPGSRLVMSQIQIQARAILMLASREMDERIKTPTGSGSEPTSPTLQSQLYSSSSSTTGLSMKRSLQRFLQKRKNRIQATSPYHS